MKLSLSTRAVINAKHVNNLAWKRAVKYNAIPKWSRNSTNRRKILKIYIDAQIRNLTSKYKNEVDHVLPLYNEFICGLHVFNNLQILSKEKNQAKSNLFSPYREKNGKKYYYFKVNGSEKQLKIPRKYNQTNKNRLKLAKKRLKQARYKSK